MDRRTLSYSAIKGRRHRLKAQSLGEFDFSLLFMKPVNPQSRVAARSFVIARAQRAKVISPVALKKIGVPFEVKKPLARLALVSRSSSQKSLKKQSLKVKHTRIHSVDSQALASLSFITTKPNLDRSDKQAEDSLIISKKLQLKSYLAKGHLPTNSSEFYSFGRELGKGSCGKVYQATHILTGLQVAIKCIDKLRLKDQRRRRKVMQEIQALHRCNGSRVVRLLEVFESKSELYIVLELMDGGDLHQYVKTNGAVDEALAKRIFVQLVQAVKLCHSLNIVHRDIKLDNVLITADQRIIKLCDFSICRFVEFGGRLKDFSGTPAYLAPEVLVNCEHDPVAADMWSLGVVLYSMLHAALPFQAEDIKALQKAVLAGDVQISKGLSCEARDLISRLLELMPQKRPRSSQVLSHPWLQNVHCTALRGEPLCGKVLSHMCALGFSESVVRRSLEGRELNQATATYYLLLGIS